MRVLSIPGSKVSFGCIVEDYSDADFEELKALVIEKLVVVVKNQSHLTPQQQYELTKRFDPEAESYGHGHNSKLMAASVLQNDLVSIPSQPQVKLLGNGHVTDHEGLASVVLKHPQHHTFHRDILSSEQEEEGYTRFFRWHMDAALYNLDPPHATTLLALQIPSGRKQTVRYDDGTGDQIKGVSLGTTAFVSGETAFQILPAHLKELALKTKVVYAPHPYIWIKRARALSNGLGLYSEGLELSPEELPPVDGSLIKTYPMVWKNNVNGKPSLQIHGCCVKDLIIDGQAVGDLSKVRDIVYEIMRPGIAPAYVYTHDWEIGDLVIFSNRSVWHSVVGTLKPDDVRVYHQCNLAGSAPVIAYNDDVHQ